MKVDLRSKTLANYRLSHGMRKTTVIPHYTLRFSSNRPENTLCFH